MLPQPPGPNVCSRRLSCAARRAYAGRRIAVRSVFKSSIWKSGPEGIILKVHDEGLQSGAWLHTISRDATGATMAGSGTSLSGCTMGAHGLTVLLNVIGF